MPAKRKINIGDKIGIYTIISEPCIENGIRKVWCQCSCGKKRHINTGQLSRLEIVNCTHCTEPNIGDKFHYLTVIEILPDRNLWGRRQIKVQCDCGIVKIISQHHLNKIKSCGCKRVSSGKENLNFKGYDFISGRHFYILKRHARERNIEFNITIEYINDLLIKQNHQCKLSKVPIIIGSRTIETTASLDRIDSSKGYIIDNVQWVHKDVNYMKQGYSLEYFIEMCNLIGQNCYNKKI